MNPATDLPEPRHRSRGRWQFVFLLLVAIGPMLLASAMYKWRFWVPEARNYHGTLIGDGRTLADLGVPTGGEERWQLVVTTPDSCTADCRELVYLARQVNIGLAREAARASHALASGEPLAADYDALLQREYPKLVRYPLDRQHYQGLDDGGATPRLWIVDPHGNLVLRYERGVNGKGVLNDLRLLLKLSHIG
ncbi:hypothetical protein [Zestomonas carbonaria]|nr:hypothetical protein [Pseudomonas carbonaria]